MKIQEFTQDLLDKLEYELSKFPLTGENRLLMIESSFFLVDRSMEQMKEKLRSYKFETLEEEISFFKNWMTKLLAHSIFYSELFHIESGKPIRGDLELPDYYRSKQTGIKKFLHRYAALNNYLVMEKSHLDKVYFIRSSKAPIIYPDLVRQTLDSSFCTVYTLQFSKILAMGRLLGFLTLELGNKDTGVGGGIDLEKTNPKLIWTGSKVALVELIYALKTAAVFNHGTASVVDLANTFGFFLGKS